MFYALFENYDVSLTLPTGKQVPIFKRRMTIHIHPNENDWNISRKTFIKFLVTRLLGLENKNTLLADFSVTKH